MNIYFICIKVKLPETQPSNIGLIAGGIGSVVVAIVLLDLTPIRRGFVPGFGNYKKGYTRLTAASDKVYQLLAQGRWFSPGTLTSSTTKTCRTRNLQIRVHVFHPRHYCGE
jgi:hypothetical protein